MGLFFDGWWPIWRTLVGGVIIYLWLIAFLRVSGKRTLAKMNAFDLVVTVSLGSTLASIIVSKDVSLAQGAVALALLISLQFVITWSSVRWQWVRRIVTGQPALLFYQGRCVPDNMRRSRVTEGEVEAAIRSGGFARLDDVEAVVLETDGSFSVLGRPPDGAATSLGEIERPA